MGMAIVLGIIFVAVTISAWCVIHLASAGWNRYEENFTENMTDKLQNMFMFVDAKRIFLFNAVAVLVVPVIVYFLTDNYFYAVIGGLGVLATPKLTYAYLQKKRLRDFEEALPDSISQIAGSMRSGATLPIAIEAMVKETKGPISQEFSLVLRETRVGIGIDEAFENLGNRVPCQDLALVVSAARIARDVGGNLAEIFDRLASTLREKATMEGKIRALTSQGKLQGWVVGMLPIGMMLVLMQMEPVAMQPLFNSVFGWGTLVVIGVLEILGMLVIRKIVSIDV